MYAHYTHLPKNTDIQYTLTHAYTSTRLQYNTITRTHIHTQHTNTLIFTIKHAHIGYTNIIIHQQKRACLFSRF